MLLEEFKAQAFVFNQNATGLFEKPIQIKLADFLNIKATSFTVVKLYPKRRYTALTLQCKEFWHNLGLQ